MRGKRAAFARLTDPVWRWSFTRQLFGWRGLLVLNYHRVGDAAISELGPTLFSATTEQFVEQIEFLSEHATVISLADVLDGRHLREPRCVLLTFDDGYRDNYTNVFPVLRRFGMPATFFVATGFIGSRLLSWWDEIAWRVAHLPDDVIRREGHAGAAALKTAALATFKAGGQGEQSAILDRLRALGHQEMPTTLADDLWLSWDMVRELHAAGMTIGGHTVTHPILARLSADQQCAEVRGCADQIAAEIGERPVAFSYPVGGRYDFDDTTQRCIREAGFQIAFSFYGGWNPADKPINPWDVRRAAELGSGLSLPEFRMVVQMPRSIR